MRTRINLLTTTATIILALATACSKAPAAPDTEPAKPTKAEPTKAQQAEKLYQQGRDALLTGENEKAVKLLTKAVATDEIGKTSYRLALARAYRYAGQVEPAAKELAAILKTAPDHVEAGQLLGEIYIAEENWAKATAVLTPLLKYRHDYTTYHMLAEATYNLDKYPEARKYFEKAIQLNPNSAADHYQLGNIYLAGHFYALAAEAYDKALRLGVSSPVLRYKLGSAYFNLRNYFGRVQVITVKAGKTGTINGSWYLIEPVPGKKDRFRAAPSSSAIYQIARATTDGIADRADIQFLKANIYLNARRYKQAYGMFGKIKKIIAKEDKALFYFYYSQAAFGIDKYDEYISLLKEAIKLDKDAYQPTLVEAYLKVAEQYNQLGQTDKYIRYLALAVAASPQTVSLHLKLGYAYEHARKYALAARQWQMVLDLQSDHPDRLKLINLIGKYKKMPAPKPT